MKIGPFQIGRDRDLTPESLPHGIPGVLDCLRAGRTEEATRALLVLSEKHARPASGFPAGIQIQDDDGSVTRHTGSLFGPGEGIPLRRLPKQCIVITASGNMGYVNCKDRKNMTMLDSKKNPIGIILPGTLGNTETKLLAPGQEIPYLWQEAGQVYRASTGPILAILALDKPMSCEEFDVVAATLQGQRLWDFLTSAFVPSQ